MKVRWAHDSASKKVLSGRLLDTRDGFFSPAAFGLSMGFSFENSLVWETNRSQNPSVGFFRPDGFRPLHFGQRSFMLYASKNGCVVSTTNYI